MNERGIRGYSIMVTDDIIEKPGYLRRVSPKKK